MSYINEQTLRKAIQFIYQHRDQAITIHDIAKSAAVSDATLKRLFKETLETSPGEFTRKMRMEIAHLSLKETDMSVLDIALNAGFEDPSSFARSFKQLFGYSPKHARNKLNIISEFEHVQLEEPKIIELKTINIQAVTEQGLYFESAPKAWSELKQKLTPVELNDDFTGVFIGIGHDNPHDGKIAEDKVRFSAGVAYLDRDLGVSQQTIEHGVYACFRYSGKTVQLGLAYHYIYGKWEETSDQKINHDKPAFMLFDTFPDSLEEQELLIHVPLVWMT